MNNDKFRNISSAKMRWLLAIVPIALIGFLVFQSFLPPPPTPSAQIRVAAILNLTGPPAQFDAVKQHTLDIGIKRLAIIKPNVDIAVRVFDAGGSPESTQIAVSEARKWGARFFLTGTSPTALAVASQVRGNPEQVVHLANAANPEFGPPRLGEYRFWPDWVHEAELVFQVIENQSIESVLLIHSADPYSVALKNSLKNKLASTSNNIDMMEFQFDPTAAADFRPALLRAKAANVKGLVIFGLPPGIRALIGQLKEVSWTESIIGGVNINLAVEQFDEAKLDCDLWLIETEAMKEELREDSEANQYRMLYKAERGEMPPFHALYLADALYFIAEAYSKPGQAATPYSDPVTLLNQVTGFEGPSGITFLEKDRTLRFEMDARHARTTAAVKQ
jgi:ABC-type branched-subunit amino acid transport system substrate-binding protein